MAAAADFLSQVGLLFEVWQGCVRGVDACRDWRADRVEQEGKGEPDHWFGPGQNVRVILPVKEVGRAPQPEPDGLEARAIPGDKSSNADSRDGGLFVPERRSVGRVGE